MTKQNEITQPASCWNKAQDMEMLFILLGRDPAAAATIRFWIRERIRLGKNQSGDRQLSEAEECAWVMEVQSP